LKAIELQADRPFTRSAPAKRFSNVGPPHTAWSVGDYGPNFRLVLSAEQGLGKGPKFVAIDASVRQGS
jgi:hypothetical protein